MELSELERSGRAIRAMRSLRGLTQREASRALGWSGSALLSRYETGDRACPSEHLEKLLDLYRFTMEEYENFKEKGGDGDGAVSGGPEKP